MKPQPLYISGVHKPVAFLDDGVLFKRANGQRHFLRKPPAISFAADILRQAQAAGCELVRVVDTTSGAIFTVALADYLANAFEVRRAGFERQLALPLWFWSKDGQPSAAQQRSERESVAQLSLFEVSG